VEGLVIVFIINDYVKEGRESLEMDCEMGRQCTVSLRIESDWEN
jgi:hypothetical protein